MESNYLKPTYFFLALALLVFLCLPASAQQSNGKRAESSTANFLDKLPTITREAPSRPGGLKNMTLQEAIDLGISQNPQMKIATERAEQARATYRQQASAKNLKLALDNGTTVQPEKSIGTDGLLRNIPSPANFPSRFVLVSPVTDQFRLSLQVLLTTFGKVENAIAAAFLQIDAQEASVDVDKLNLAYSVKNAFFAKLKADATVDVARENLQVAKQNLDDTNALFEQGVMSRYDVLQAQIEVTRSVQDLAQSLTLVDQALAQITNVLSEESFFVQPLAPAPIEVDENIEIEALDRYAIEHRPEIKVLNCQQAVAQKLRDSALAESRPTVTLAASYQTALGQSLAPVDVPSLTLQVQWQLFDGGYRKAKIAETDSVLRSLEASKTKLGDDIKLQVSKTWLDLKQTVFNVATAQQQLDSAEEYYDMARRRYLNGLATTLEVADSMRNLIKARSHLVETKYDRDLAFARLELALGQNIPERILTKAYLAAEEIKQ